MTHVRRLLSAESLGLVLLETAIIVAGVLIALGADAWWDSRQELEERGALLSALTRDFRSTRNRLAPILEQARSHAAQSGGYIDIVLQGRDVPDDSLRALIGALGEITYFEPEMASYRTALSDGSIGLVRDDTLLQALADFEQGLDWYDLHLGLSGQMYYLGSSHDLRRRFGSVEAPMVIEDNAAVRAMNPEGIDLRGKEVFAAMEPVWRIHENLAMAYADMADATDRILAALERLDRE